MSFKDKKPRKVWTVPVSHTRKGPGRRHKQGKIETKK